MNIVTKYSNKLGEYKTAHIKAYALSGKVIEDIESNLADHLFGDRIRGLGGYNIPSLNNILIVYVEIDRGILIRTPQDNVHNSLVRYEGRDIKNKEDNKDNKNNDLIKLLI